MGFSTTENFEMHRRFCLLSLLSVSHILYNLADSPQGLFFIGFIGAFSECRGSLLWARHSLNLFLSTSAHRVPILQISLQLHLLFCTAFSKFLSTPDVSCVLPLSLILYLDFIFLFRSSYYIITNTTCPIRHMTSSHIHGISQDRRTFIPAS